MSIFAIHGDEILLPNYYQKANTIASHWDVEHLFIGTMLVIPMNDVGFMLLKFLQDDCEETNFTSRFCERFEMTLCGFSVDADREVFLYIAHAEKNNLGLTVLEFERRRVLHGGSVRYARANTTEMEDSFTACLAMANNMTEAIENYSRVEYLTQGYYTSAKISDISKYLIERFIEKDQ